MPPALADLSTLISAALLLGASPVPGLPTAASVDLDVEPLRSQILAGSDPLGDAFCALRSGVDRRPLGQIFTPAPLVDRMIAWAAGRGGFQRVVDPGTGSARFLIQSAAAWPRAELVGVESDPLCVLISRANLQVHNLSARATVHLGDYRDLALPAVPGRTLFLGNPPYVRHHQISTRWKKWLRDTAASAGLRASQLAGLHVHFFLATWALARPGDVGCFVTSSEWLDVNYGRLLRDLLLTELGGTRVDVMDAAAMPFAEVMTTAAITCFEVGEPPSALTLSHTAEPERVVPREVLASSPRWSPLLRPPRQRAAGLVELGELCRVHRGQVTGANAIWVVDAASDLPAHLLYPAVTRARELFQAGDELTSTSGLRQVVDLPSDLDQLDPASRALVEAFLDRARRVGAHEGYIARARKPWWAVGLREPAPIIASYMARRPPAFVRNPAGARHINIAHGIYPREPMSPSALDSLAAHLRSSVTLHQGRVYAGGLTKFEPREMERLLVPPPPPAPAPLSRDPVNSRGL